MGFGDPAPRPHEPPVSAPSRPSARTHRSLGSAPPAPSRLSAWASSLSSQTPEHGPGAGGPQNPGRSPGAGGPDALLAVRPGAHCAVRLLPGLRLCVPEPVHCLPTPLRLPSILVPAHQGEPLQDTLPPLPSSSAPSTPLITPSSSCCLRLDAITWLDHFLSPPDPTVTPQRPLPSSSHTQFHPSCRSQVGPSPPGLLDVLSTESKSYHRPCTALGSWTSSSL